MKELDQEAKQRRGGLTDVSRPSTAAGEKTGSDEDAVLVDAEVPATPTTPAIPTTPATPITPGSAKSNKKKKGKK